MSIIKRIARAAGLGIIIGLALFVYNEPPIHAFTHGKSSGGGSVPVVTAATFYTYSPATSTQAVGTVTATNSPTSWNITAGNSAGDFAISSGGAITVTSQGQTDLTGGTIAVSFTLTVTATNSSGTSSGQSIPITVYADGFAGAPTCSVQFATLLNGYHSGGAGSGRAKGNGYQPPWNVAGVDYCVGVPSGQSLSAPGTLSNPPSVTINNSLFQVTVVATGTPIVLDSIDFTQNGGWQVIIHNDSAGDVTISNSNFSMTSNNQTFLNVEGGSSGNLVITDSTFTGSGSRYLSATNACLFFNTGTTMTTLIKYSYINNCDEDFWDAGPNSTSKFNLWYNDGQGSSGGPHPDWMQLVNGAEGDQVHQFNTYYQTSHGQNGTQGLGFYGAGGTAYSLNSATVTNNTLIAGTNSGNNYIFSINFSGTVTGGGTGSLIGAANFNNNYVDPTGTSTAFMQTLRSLTGGATFTQTGNFNMNTGAAMNCTNLVTC